MRQPRSYSPSSWGPSWSRTCASRSSCPAADFTIFVSRPISGVTLAIAFLLLLSNLLPFMKRRRAKVEEILKEE